MFSPLLRKVFADFSTRWARSLVTLAGLVVGLSAVIAIATSFFVLSDNLEQNYTDTNPYNVEAILGDIEPSLVQTLGTIPSVFAAEERRKLNGRIEVRPDVWMPLIVYVVEDFENMRVATFDPEAGAWPARDDEMLIERDGRYFLNTPFEDNLNIRLTDGIKRTLKYVGTVHDAGQPQSRMERLLYAYVSRSTYDAWQIEAPTSRVLFTVDETNLAQNLPENTTPHAVPAAESRVKFVADHVPLVVNYHDAQFIETDINDTKTAPHQFQLDSIIGLLIGLLVTAIVLCAALTVNLVDSILTAEVRQIGIMKAIGGRRAQIVRSYLLGMGMFGGFAALIGLFWAISFGVKTAHFVAAYINFEILSESLPFWFAPLMLGFGAFLPVVLTWWRVNQAISKPVKSALQNDDHVHIGDRLQNMRAISWLPLIPHMALKNLFRNPRRSVLTISMVVIGLSSYLVATNMRAALNETIEAVNKMQRSDILLNTVSPVDPSAMSVWLEQNFKEVEDVEYWSGRPSTLLNMGETIGRKQSVKFVPSLTKMYTPKMMEGSWINEDRPTGIVVSNFIYLNDPDMKIGSVYDFEVGDKRVSVTIVGVLKEFGGGIIYAPQGLAKELGVDTQKSNLIMLKLRNRSASNQIRISRELETKLVNTDWHVGNIVTTAYMELIVRGHIDIIVKALKLVASLLLVVCGLGLASSTSVSVMERSREIGILKAIGGTSGRILSLFIWEALFIALISWGLAMLIAPYPSRALSSMFGMLLVQYPFDYRAAEWGWLVALGIAVGVAIVSSFLPAHSATKLSVQKAIQTT